MSLSNFIVSPIADRRQVVSITEFQRFKPDKDCNMDENITARLEASINGVIAPKRFDG